MAPNLIEKVVGFFSGSTDEKKPQPRTAPKIVSRSAFIAEHTVAPGDSLSSISKKYYKSANHYPLIYEANKKIIGDDPNMIIDGTVLKIPRLPEKGK